MAKVALIAVFAALVAVTCAASLGQDPEILKRQIGIQKAMEAGCYNRNPVDAKQGLINTATRWPNGVVVYSWDLMAFTSQEKKTILEGFNWISNKTCIKFQERLLEPYYVLVNRKSAGCNAELGYKKRAGQSLNLQRNDASGTGCVYPGPAAHEMLHALGIDHEQNRPDRDDYITVMLDNVQDSMRHNFAKNNATQTYGLDYDFDSIMHYGRTSFSKNGQDTMVSKVAGKKVRDNVNYDYITAKDIALIKKMYNCA